MHRNQYHERGYDKTAEFPIRNASSNYLNLVNLSKSSMCSPPHSFHVGDLTAHTQAMPHLNIADHSKGMTTSSLKNLLLGLVVVGGTGALTVGTLRLLENCTRYGFTHPEVVEATAQAAEGEGEALELFLHSIWPGPSGA